MGFKKKNIHIRLIRIRKGAQQTRRSAIVHQPLARGDAFLLELLDFGPVHPHHEQTCDESAEDLAENVVGDFLPREALPDSEADGDGRVEVTARGRGASDDRKGDADGESPADLEEGAECRYADGVFEVEGEGGDGGDAGEAGRELINEYSGAGCCSFSYSHVVEDACCFSHTFSQPPRPGFTARVSSCLTFVLSRSSPPMLEIEFPLRYRLLGDYVSRVMSLHGLGSSNLDCRGCEQANRVQCWCFSYGHGSPIDAYCHPS